MIKYAEVLKFLMLAILTGMTVDPHKQINLSINLGQTTIKFSHTEAVHQAVEV